MWGNPVRNFLRAKPEYPASQELADFFLSQFRERGELLTNLKLQKLLYYADAWHLALYDKELTNERFEAWVHGPVAVSQYHRFKDFTWRPIDMKVNPAKYDDAVAKHLSEIIEVFGGESAVALEIMTHSEKPWIEARGGIPPDEPSNNIISKEITKNFYKAMIEPD